MEFKDIFDWKLRDGSIELNFLYKGGAHLHDVEEKFDDLPVADLLVLMVGGNDVADGATDSYVEASYERVLRRALDRGFKAVTMTSLWPRFNGRYNEKIFRLNSTLFEKYDKCSNARYWLWDERQPFKTTEDRVHLEKKGYRKAAFYLIGAIVCSINHML